MSAKSFKRVVGVVGAGRVGAVLGAALARAGHRVVAASGVSTASIDRIEKLLPGAELLPSDQVAANADLILLAVPDDALAGLVKGLAEVGAFAPTNPGTPAPRGSGLGPASPGPPAGFATRAGAPAGFAAGAGT